MSEPFHKPQSICIELLSDTTFGRGEGTAGQVDVEVEHDEFGIPFHNGKAIRSLLRDSWLSMQPHFPELQAAGLKLFGPASELDETSILRIGRADIDSASRSWIEAAVKPDKSAVTPAAVLAGFTDIRMQTSEERLTGAPERTTLRSMRVVLRGLKLEAPLQWLIDPGDDERRCLALCVLATRHLGLSRNRGRGHVRMSLDGNVKLTQKLAQGEPS